MFKLTNYDTVSGDSEKGKSEKKKEGKKERHEVKLIELIKTKDRSSSEYKKRRHHRPDKYGRTLKEKIYDV